jgi:hypothetical protein
LAAEDRPLWDMLRGQSPPAAGVDAG